MRSHRASKPLPPSRPAGFYASSWFWGAALLAAALALYWRSLDFPLVFDDRLLRDDFLNYYGTSLFRGDARWFSYASFGWTYEVIGKQWPWHRLLNVLLHALTATTLYVFLLKLFTAALGDAPDQVKRWRMFAGFGAMIFLVHPISVYGVAYLVQRSVVMTTLFGLLALIFFLNGLIRHDRRWYFASAAAYFVCVFSKEHGVMIPAVAMALSVLLRGLVWRNLRDLLLPFSLYLVIAALITLRVKGLLGAPYEPFAGELIAQLADSPGSPAAAPAYSLSIINQGHLFFQYLLLWLIPYPGWMSIDIRPSFPAHVLGWPHTAGFALWVAWPLLALALLRKSGRRGLAGFVMLFPWLLSLTEISSIRVQEPMVLYRSYLWMCVLPALLPVLTPGIAAARYALLMTSACAALVVAMQDRLSTFASAIALWDDAVRHARGTDAPLAERAYHNRGFAYLQARRYTEALADFDRAIAINRGDANAWTGRGTLQMRIGNFEQAITDLNHATALDPRYAEPHAKLCFAKMMQNEPSAALAYCDKTISLDSRHREALTNRGVVYAALGRGREAFDNYRRALEVDRNNPDAHYNLGVLLITEKREREAQPHLRIACDARIRAACEMLRPSSR